MNDNGQLISRNRQNGVEGWIQCFCFPFINQQSLFRALKSFRSFLGSRGRGDSRSMPRYNAPARCRLKSTILVPCSEIFSFFLGGRGPTRSRVCPGSNAPGRTRRTGTLPAQKLTSFPYDGGAYLAAGFFDNRKTGRNESGRRSVPCGIFDTMPQAVSKMSKMKAGLYFTHYVQAVSKMSKMRRGRFSTPCLKQCLKCLK